MAGARWRRRRRVALLWRGGACGLRRLFAARAAGEPGALRGGESSVAASAAGESSSTRCGVRRWPTTRRSNAPRPPRGVRPRRPRRSAGVGAPGADRGRARGATARGDTRLPPPRLGGEHRGALAMLDEQLARRPVLIALFRDLREAGEASGEELLAALRGSGRHPRSPEAAARCLRVLERARSGAGVAGGGAGSRRRRILRGDRTGALSRVPRLRRSPPGGPAIPRTTHTALEQRELLADLFAVVEEFDSA